MRVYHRRFLLVALLIALYAVNASAESPRVNQGREAPRLVWGGGTKALVSAAKSRGFNWKHGDAHWKAKTVTDEVLIQTIRVAKGRQLPEAVSEVYWGKNMVLGDVGEIQRNDVLLILHGNRQTPEEYRLLIDEAKQKGLTVYAPQGPGIGNLSRKWWSPWKRRADASLMPGATTREKDFQYADAVFAKAKNLAGKEGRVFIAAGSRSGFQAAYLYRRYPEQIEAISLFSPFFGKDQNQLGSYRKMKTLDQKIPFGVVRRVLAALPSYSDRDMSYRWRALKAKFGGAKPEARSYSTYYWPWSPINHGFTTQWAANRELELAAPVANGPRLQVWSSANDHGNLEAMDRWWNAIGGSHNGTHHFRYPIERTDVGHAIPDQRQLVNSDAPANTARWTVEFFLKQGEAANGMNNQQ